MQLISVIIQGIIQGFTEFLPVSSSGHLSLYNYFANGGDMTEGSLTVILHFGTLIAVFIAFRKRIWALILELGSSVSDICNGKFTLKNMTTNRRMLVMLIVACIPLIFVYPFRDTIAGFAEDDGILIEGICFLITGVLLIISSRVAKKNKGTNQIPLKSSLVVGVFQALATFPGLSRSGATISAGLFTGLSKQTSFEFSFILGIPAILAAFILDISDIVSTGESIVPGAYMVIGVVVSAVVGYLCIVLLNILLKKDKFIFFGFYTITLGVLAIALSLYKMYAV